MSTLRVTRDYVEMLFLLNNLLDYKYYRNLNINSDLNLVDNRDGDGEESVQLVTVS